VSSKQRATRGIAMLNKQGATRGAATLN
jgi:hypothetical protein